MSLFRALAPALAASVLILGCKSKAPVDKVPATAPTAIQQPWEVLQHLKYMGVYKDLKHTSILVPTEPEFLYPSAQYFHKQAGVDLGIALTQEEINGLDLKGLQQMGYVATISAKELQDILDQFSQGVIKELPPSTNQCQPDKLDKLPMDKVNGKVVPDYQTIRDQYARQAMAGGLYRLIKGIPAEVWPEISMMETKLNPQDAKFTSVTLAFRGEPVLELALFHPSANKPYTITYMKYMKSLKWFKKTAAAIQGK